MYIQCPHCKLDIDVDVDVDVNVIPYSQPEPIEPHGGFVQLLNLKEANKGSRRYPHIVNEHHTIYFRVNTADFDPETSIYIRIHSHKPLDCARRWFRNQRIADFVENNKGFILFTWNMNAEENNSLNLFDIRISTSEQPKKHLEPFLYFKPSKIVN